MDIAALILSSIALGFSMYCFIDLMAQRKSTHKIQVVDPLELLGKGQEPKPVDSVHEDLRDFDMPDAAELAMKEMMAKRNKDVI